MNLKNWLQEENINKNSFSKELGITRQHLYRVLKERKCSDALAKQIEELTKGKVKKDRVFSKQKDNPDIKTRVASLEKVAIELKNTMYSIKKKIEMKDNSSSIITDLLSKGSD